MRMLLLTLIIGLVVSCAPKIQYTITKPPSMGLSGVENIEFGRFVDELGAPIEMPQGTGSWRANQRLGERLKSHLMGYVSLGNNYRLLESGEGSGEETAVLTAKVRFVIKSNYAKDQDRFSPTAVILSAPEKEGRGLASFIAAAAVPRYTVDSPAVEKLAALEVTLEIQRKSDGQSLLGPKTYARYLYNKWGVNERPMMITGRTLDEIRENYPKYWRLRDRTEDPEELQESDPSEYQARGLHLRQHGEVAFTDQDMAATLLEEVAYEFARLVVRTQEVAQVRPAGGDGDVVALINGGAFSEAVNRLHSLPQPLYEEDHYNLGLCYEAMGNYRKAKSLYEEGLERFDSSIFERGLKRLK